MKRTKFSPFFETLDAKIQAYGGAFNAHLHIDRAGTYDETVRLLQERGVRDGANSTLAGKHSMIPMIHASHLYDPKSLIERVSLFLDAMIEVGTVRADSVVDVTTDRVGTTALDTLLELSSRYAGRIDFRLGAYSPLGFRDDEPARWALVEGAVERAHFMGILPERDDRGDYPDHIGFAECCRRSLVLAARHGKDLHIHVDQANHPNEGGGEVVARLVSELGLGRKPGTTPFVWLIHLISPSTYPEPRFRALAEDLAELGIGVICCPSAAISMRQLRPLMSPAYNCIARVLDLMDAGVQVRIGSDNVCDITSPMGTPDLLEEIFVLANAMRIYDTGILARIAVGQPLDDAERVRLRKHLEEDAAAVAQLMDKHAKPRPTEG